MSSRESRAAAGCAIAGGGAVGSLHVFGPGPGPYVSVEAEAYDAYGFTRSTPERVVQALGNFTRWARGINPGPRSMNVRFWEATGVTSTDSRGDKH